MRGAAARVDHVVDHAEAVAEPFDAIARAIVGRGPRRKMDRATFSVHDPSHESGICAATAERGEHDEGQAYDQGAHRVAVAGDYSAALAHLPT